MRKSRKPAFLVPAVILVLLVVVGGAFMINGCTDAEIASRSLSKAADQFQIVRRVVFYNGITDKYILQIEGRCSVEFKPDKFVVTCKVGDDEYVKHYLGRADNVFPFVEQIRGANVSTSHYKVIFKPSAIIPDIDLR